MKAYLAIPIVIIMLAVPLVQACMSPYDQYSVEVLLNKPGVGYNSSISVPSILKVDNMSFILRVWEAKDGPHVRVEIPLTRQRGAYWGYTGPVVITNGTIQKLLGRGWIATSITRNGSSIDVLQKGNVTIKITKPQGECTSDSDCATGGCSGELCLPNYIVSHVASVCIYAPWYECFKLTSCGCVNGTCSWKPNEAFKKCLREHGVDPSRVIRAGVSEVTATGPNPEELTDALKEFFNATGANCTKFNLISGSEEKPAYNPGEVDAGKVLSRALEYLMETGAVTGLTKEDVGQIVEVAKWGGAGYNGKIGWYETENGSYAWIPYDESPNATLVRCGWAGPPTYGNASSSEGNGTVGTGHLDPGSGPNVTGGFGNHTTPNPAVNPPQNEMASTTKNEEGSAVCGPASLLVLTALPLLARKKKK
nr:CGP-CTERM-anchored Cys-rich protein [Thermococcus sp. Bubb.Bath]